MAFAPDAARSGPCLFSMSAASARRSPPKWICRPRCRRPALNVRQVARLDRAGAMLLLAANEAWRQAGWESAENLPLVLGTTAGGMTLGEAYFRQALQTPLRQRRQPTRAVYYQAQVQARMVLDALNFSGPITIISNACASGSNAVGHAWDLIRSGQAECAFAGGYDALSELVFSGFDALQVLSPTVCRPFDAKRDGLALGEGAAMLALETLDRARRRNAPILGELIAYSTSIDHHHLTQPHPQGDTTLKVMRQACATAGIAPGRRGLHQRPRHGHSAQRQFGGACHRPMGGQPRDHVAGQLNQGRILATCSARRERSRRWFA